VLVVVGLLSHSSAAPVSVEEMHERYWALSDIRDHVIEGKLDEARAEAGELKELPTKKRVRRKWRPYLATVDAALASVQDASSLDDAAAAVGEAAASCGSCHEATGGGPQLVGAANVPDQKWDAGQNMALHRWAMDWMWLGLVDHNDDAWSRGASELDNKPLLFQYPRDGASPAAELEQKVYDLAKYATTTGADRRGEVFGILIATCSECHAKLVPTAEEPAPSAEAEPEDSDAE